MAPAFDFKSMDKKKLGIIALAVVAGLVAVVLTNGYIEQNSREKAKKMVGGMSSEETQKLMQRIQTLEQANQELANRQNALAQAQQQAAAQAQQAPPVKTQQSLAIKTPVGKRAFTAMVDKISAVGGMVSPGDHVDIIVHLNIPAELKSSGQTDSTTVTLFQDVLVLAVGDSMQPGVASSDAQTATSTPITFALNPQESGLISFAQKNGTLQLVLRPPLDNEAYVLPVSTWNSLSQYIASTQGSDLGVKSPQGSLPQPQEPVVEKKPQIEIFRGGQ